MDKKQLVPLVAALLFLGAVFWFFSNGITSSSGLKVSGNIELTEIEASFEIPGRVVERPVDEGEYVKAGQLIALLDSRSLENEVGVRRAALEAAEAALLELERGYLPEEINQAEAKLEQSKAELNRLQAEYERQKELFDTNVISQKEFDLSTASHAVAKARVREAKEGLELLRRGIREEKIEQARARLEESKQSLALAETRLSYAALYAPSPGWVLSKNIEPGEVVVGGTPIVSIGNLDDVWLRAYINETDLGRVKLGQKVDVTTSSYPGKIYSGTITFISSEAEFTPKNVQTEKERVKLVYRIKVKLDNSKQELKPGMPADGVILLD